MTSIAQAYAEGRIIRGKWSDTDAQGRELLCLYTALAGDANARPADCPASLCPDWLAHLLPWIDDAGSKQEWPGAVARVVAIAPRLGELQGERSERLRSRCLAVILREALSYAGECADAVRGVLSLCERHGGGEQVSAQEWESAARAAEAAAEAEDRIIAGVLSTIEQELAQ